MMLVPELRHQPTACLTIYACHAAPYTSDLFLGYHGGALVSVGHKQLIIASSTTTTSSALEDVGPTIMVKVSCIETGMEQGWHHIEWKCKARACQTAGNPFNPSPALLRLRPQHDPCRRFERGIARRLAKGGGVEIRTRSTKIAA